MTKKHSQKKAVNHNRQKVLPISRDIELYQDALALYRKHSTVPTFLFVLDMGLKCGVRLETLEKELIHLVPAAADTYFGAVGSKYFNNNYEDLELIYKYRLERLDAISICVGLWKILEEVQPKEVWVCGGLLVGASEFDYLNSIFYAEDAIEAKEDKSTTNSPILGSSFQKLISDVVKADTQKSEALGALANEAKTLGAPMVPWTAWIKDYLPERSELAEGLHDLSSYIGSYFSDNGTHEINNDRSSDKLLDLDDDNCKAFVRIASFLLFCPLYKKVIYDNSTFEWHNFYGERIELLSDRNLLNNPLDEAEYIIAISNLLMMAAKLDVQVVKEGLASPDELSRAFLNDTNNKYQDLACIVTLPSSGFVQIIEAADPYATDDGSSGYDLKEALRVSDFGMPVPWDSESFDEMFDRAFGDMDDQVASLLRPTVEKISKKWLLPLRMTTRLTSFYEDFRSDEKIIEKISDALFLIDKKDDASQKFSYAILEGIANHSDDMSSDLHPIMFALKFSNREDFFDFSESEWMRFSKSLLKAGQIRHSCTLLALYITIHAVKIIYNVKVISMIDVPAIVRNLKEVSGFQSFGIVRRAIADLIEAYDQVPPILNGSLKEFMPSSSASVIPFKKKAEDRYEVYKKHLLDSGHIVTRLSSDARESLLKGYTLARDKDLAVFNLSGDAVRNYVLAVEGELRSRVTDIDSTLAEELKYMDVDIDWKPRPGMSGRRGVFRGLTSICRAVDIFHSLSTASQAKLQGFKSLAMHKDIDLFKRSMKEFTAIRNAIQHADAASMDAGSFLVRVEELMFGGGGLVRVLCETR